MSTTVGETGFSPPDVRERPGEAAAAASRVALAALAVAFGAAALAGVEVPLREQMVIYLFGMVALNLPHGGYEHFANLRRRGVTFQGRYVAAYLALMAGFVGLLVVAPVAGLALALAVAVAKGGWGDLATMEAVTGADHVRGRGHRLLAAFVRGGSVMLVPIVFWPGTFYQFSWIMVSVFDAGALAGVPTDLGATRTAVAAVYGVALLAHLTLGYARAPELDSYLVDAGETLLLVTYFAVVPVVAAVGLYFPLWYSLRQVGRTAAVEEDLDPAPDAPLAVEDPTRATLVAWAALIGGAVAVGGLFAGLYLLAPNPFGTAGLLPGLVALWSLFISVVALPHVVVGSWADRDRGIWYVP